MFRNARFPLLSFWLLLAVSPALQGACRPWIPHEVVASTLLVGNIELVSKDVFDLDNENENMWLHKTANYLHIETKDHVIKRQLLFNTGEIYSPLLIEESERLLRANRYIKTASIYPLRICGNSVDVRVVTTDSWTLTPSISVGRSGGVNTGKIELEEHNVFGYGKELAYKKKTDDERTTNALSYRDNNVLGTRYIFSSEIQNNSDGRVYSMSGGLPFYQLASQYSWNISVDDSTRENAIYDRGSIVDKIGRDTQEYDVLYGWSHTRTSDAAMRYRIGWSYRDTQSFRSAEFPSGIIPADFIYSSPYFGMQYTKHRYLKETNLFSVGVTEDIALGDNFDVQLGWVNEQWGSTDNLLSLTSTYKRGFHPSRKQLALIEVGIDGLFDKKTVTDGVFSGRADWFLRHGKRRRLHVFGLFEVGRNLFIDNQISLGGDSGLRGYPIKYQNGDRKYLVSIEERYFFDWYPFHLVKTGVSVFADAGSAWDSRRESRDTLGDVGFGFLIASTRQSNNNILRIDFAFPLDDRDTVDSFQLLVGSQAEF